MQVSSNFSLNESFYLTLDVKPSEALEVENDFALNAHDYGILNTTNTISKITGVGCQSIFDGEITCNPAIYSKSLWQKFTTDNHVDFIRFKMGESPLNSPNAINRDWYINLYEGDISIDSTNLTLIGSCHNLQQINTDLASVDWKCILNANTTYSIQILFKNDYYSSFTTEILQHGILPTQGYDPNNLTSNNALGLLNLGTNYTINEHFSCNSFSDYYVCPSSIDTIFPPLTSNVNPVSWWATFEIDNYANLILGIPNYNPTYNPQIQLFSGSISDSCSLSPIALPFNCLEPGTYSILVTGKGILSNNLILTNLAKEVDLTINTTAINTNNFGLETSNNIDSINDLAPLVNNILYPSTTNYFDCNEDIILENISCGNNINRAMYRLIHIDNFGKLEITNGSNFFEYQIFSDDLRNLSIDSNKLEGGIPHTCCFNLTSSSVYKMCVDSGYYTIVTYGDINDIGRMDAIGIKFSTIVTNPFTNPLFPDILPNLSLNNLSISGTDSKMDCTYNPDTILGLPPCANNNHTTYKEFQILDTLSLNYIPIGGSNGSKHRVFAGRRSTNSITSLIEDCFSGFNTTLCKTLNPGWYTIVTYTPISFPQCSNNTGNTVNIGINSEPPFTPLFNTFDKADSIDVKWFQRNNHTDSIPSQWQVINIVEEEFNCYDDLNFPQGINPCFTNQNRVSYRVLHIKKPSYLFLYKSTINLTHNLYEGDITKMNPPFLLIDSCFSMNKRICIDSGIYTIVSFASDANIKQTYEFSIYVDSIVQSKYDYAANAYNFGVIPNNSTAYFYNPSIPTDQFADYLNRPASNDFITCSTNSSINEPNEFCYTPNFYSGNRKTLWYTFELDSPGVCTVDVNTLTLDKRNVSWAIYKSNTNTYPLIDSIVNNLTLIRKSNEDCDQINWGDVSSLSFDVDACEYQKERYVIIVTNKDKQPFEISEEPNIQVNVSVKLDPVPIYIVNYNYYSNANEINGDPTINCSLSNTNDTISYGSFSGCSADLTCATKSLFDNTNCGENTVWYKFNAIGSGSIKLNYFRDDTLIYDFNNGDLKLYRATIPGDSINGLQQVPLTSATFNNHPNLNGNLTWGVGCFSTGTYYLMFTGCNFYKATVTPNVWLEHKIGDFCFDAVPLIVTNEDSVSVSASVDCWTIGEAPGEDGTNMGCLGYPYYKKSGWFQIFLANDSIVDLDVTLQENTTASSSDISYRFATGNCNALTYQTCVNGAGFLTLNLKCRADSFLYVQMVLPSSAEGTLDFTLKTTYAQDTTCVPSDPDIPNANFTYSNFCENEPIYFTNNSTIGSAMTYQWDFGDGNTSSDFNPVNYYADSGSYIIQLIVNNSFYSDTNYNLIHIQPGPDGAISIPQIACKQNPTLFETQGTDTSISSNYYWFIYNLNNGFVEYVTGLDYYHEFDYSGIYAVCLYNNLLDNLCPLITCDTIHVFNDFNDTIFNGTCNFLDTGIVILANTSIAGCDSSLITITTLNLNKNDTVINYSCLESDTNIFVFNGITSLGCDSIFTEITLYQPPTNDTILLATCFSVDTGIFVSNSSSIYGCDSNYVSIRTLNPSFNNVSISNSCNLADTGIFIVSDTTILGCDSLTTTIVNLATSHQDTIIEYSCFEEDTGTIISKNLTLLGCDSNIYNITSLSFPKELLFQLQDTTFCDDEIGYVYIQEKGHNFLWSEGTLGTSFSPNISGIYFVEFTQDGTNCKVVDSIEVTIENCNFNCEIIWPDAFTPNNDQLNDDFKPIRNLEDIQILEFRIYNRWGEIVHNNINPWDGYFQGKLQEAAVYTLYLKYICKDESEEKTHLGIINLIR